MTNIINPKQVNSSVKRGPQTLKRAIMELGPNGHPFEKLVSELLRSEGFTVKVGEIARGKCVSHEIDIVAEKNNRHMMVECKFHNENGIRSDVKVSLYVQARFEDVRRQWESQPGHGNKFHEVCLVTNTEFTKDAIQYASCVGMKAIGWNYPANGNLQELIEASGLYPLTCISSISNLNKHLLLDKGLVLCKELLENRGIMEELKMSEDEINKIEQEINNLCKHK